MRGATSALAFMHEAGVVHRSLGASSLRVNALGEMFYRRDGLIVAVKTQGCTSVIVRL